MQTFTFEDIYNQNHRRIHYHFHKLNIRDPYKEYYSEGLIALWQAYKTYDADKGPMPTYFNFIIRNRLVDLLRKQNIEQSKMEKYLEDYARPLKTAEHTSKLSLEEILIEDKTINGN